MSEQDPANSHSLDPERQQSVLDHNRRRIAELQNVLYAESEQSLLLILQSMDTGGKDPIIRDVLNLTNPQACRAVAFKKAGGVEEKHDMFWRFHRAAPERGEIVVFNRSWYDTMIASRAHGEIDENELAAVCRQICAFESVLADQRISIVKVFLHISKDEQRKRLQERIDDPHRHWELSEADFSERKFWDGYARAYDEVITATNTDQCPWYIIPADDRHYRDAAASVIIAGALEALNPQYPPAKFDVSSIEWE